MFLFPCGARRLVYIKIDVEDDFFFLLSRTLINKTSPRPSKQNRVQEASAFYHCSALLSKIDLHLSSLTPPTRAEERKNNKRERKRNPARSFTPRLTGPPKLLKDQQQNRRDDCRSLTQSAPTNGADGDQLSVRIHTCRALILARSQT